MIWFVTGYLVRPVAEMAATANRIAEGHLDSEVPPPAGARETADLAVDLEEMIARLRAAIDEANDERRAMERFLADMAHEIRTPLTALKGYSDLYRNGMLEAPTTSISGHVVDRQRERATYAVGERDAAARGGRIRSRGRPSRSTSPIWPMRRRRTCGPPFYISRSASEIWARTAPN